MTFNGVVLVSTSGSGKGGDLIISNFDEVNIVGGIGSSSQPTAIGNPGSITIQANQSITFTNAVISIGNIDGGVSDINIESPHIFLSNSRITSGTGGGANGGSITLLAEEIVMTTDDGSPSASRIDVSTSGDDSGDAGTILIETSSLVLNRGSMINANSFGGGNTNVGDGGLIIINADFLEVRGHLPTSLANVSRNYF